MLMAKGEECLDGWVRADGGEVKGGGVDFGVTKSLLGEIPGENLELMEGPFDSRWVVIGDYKEGIPNVANPTANLPYGMFLTRLYRHIMEAYPHLDNGIYDIVDRVMRPLALKQTRRPRSDRSKARHSVLSSSSHHHGTSSHQHDDDDDDVKTSRASTPSLTTYLNSLDPLNYQNYQMPFASEQTDETIFERQTTLLNQTQEMHKEMRGGFKSFGKALKGVFSKKKK
ncbi:hypothetical protein Tco_0044365 [Tanacetum coccineum]